jgi:hypothetical protein
MNPEHCWEHFLRWLDSLLQSRAPVADLWLWPWVHTHNVEQLEAEYAAMEARCEPELKLAVEELLESGSLRWESLSAQAAALLAIRLAAAASFASECAVSAGERQMIAFPDAPYSEFLAWLLRDWWRERGVARACRMWIAHHWDEAPEY